MYLFGGVVQLICGLAVLLTAGVKLLFCTGFSDWTLSELSAADRGERPDRGDPCHRVQGKTFRHSNPAPGLEAARMRSLVGSGPGDSPLGEFDGLANFQARSFAGAGWRNDRGGNGHSIT